MVVEIHEGQGNIPSPGLVVRDIHEVVAACWGHDAGGQGCGGQNIPSKAEMRITVACASPQLPQGSL